MTAAPIHDPETGQYAPCPCGCQGATGPGAASHWHQRKGPLPLLRARHGLERWQAPRWLDHWYRLRLPDGRWCYVAEPYDLGADALEDLVWLGQQGYEVSITAWQARHYPGHALAVRIVETSR